MVNLRTDELEQRKESLTNAHGDTPDNRKSEGCRWLKGVDRLVRLLPFACAFKSTKLKA